MATFSWKTAEDIKAERRGRQLEALRGLRDRALRESDWMLLPDSPISADQRNEIIAYRRGLRDLIEKVATAPEWQAGVQYTAGSVVAYGAGAYGVIQTHTSQADWTPDISPALFRFLGDADLLREQPDIPPEWVKPTGAHDAYSTGDRVTFEGRVYESRIDGNVWSPREHAQGWRMVT